ncbi:MAG: DNA repair protein RecO [Bacteroidales bacterium]|nr:DNA repair protein RecO [Bacteroidales bacterium]
MQLTTQGLVLHTTPYGETSVIARILTRQLGLRSYIAKNVRSRSARTKQNLFQPMTWLDMVVYNNPRHAINHIRELSPLPQPEPTMQHLALKFFMAEVLYRSLRDDEPMPALFDYTTATLANLDSADLANLPIAFLLAVADHLGIAPRNNHSPARPVFSLDEGCFVSPSFSATDTPQAVLDYDQSALLHTYLDPANTSRPPLADRSRLLTSLLDYYKIHLATFGQFKSHEILHAVLS